MSYKLIADVGSTKAHWVLLNTDQREDQRFETEGLNALTAESDGIEAMAKAVRNRLTPEADPDEIYYYGAGCATPEICKKVAQAISKHFAGSKVNVATDLLGASRSLLGRDSGIACILGTGSNSCRYDGDGIIGNVPSLGFILGDEGSGAALGKRLVADAFKGKLPSPIRDRFLDRYKLTLGEILEKIYKQPAPNKFLASLVPFIHEHLWNPHIYAMVRREFGTFLDRNISPYENCRSVPISFTGSIAFHFSDILREAVSDGGYRAGKITAHPIDGLIEFHTVN